MTTDIIPIAVYVNRKVLLPPAKQLIEPLQLDLQVVINILIGHFHEMGIFFVPPTHEPIILDQILKQLRISPEIQRVTAQAANARARAKPKRA